MSRSLRVQLSLIFTDEDLFDNFITPLKENKELSGLIIKLLKTYYENDEVRDAVEGISYDNVFEDGGQVIDSTEAINQMRQTLAMQDFLFEQAKQTLDDGASEMDALMRANDIAKQAGVVKTESGDNGEVLAKLIIENPTSDSNPSTGVNSADNSELEGRVKKIEDAISGIFDLLKNGTYTQSTSTTSVMPVVEKTDEVVETPILKEEVEVPLIKEDKSEVLANQEVTPELKSDTVAEVTYVAEDNVISSPEPKEEDASGVLSDVLKDLLG